MASTALWPFSRGARMPNTCFEVVEQILDGTLRDADRAVALHVGVSAQRADAGALLADVAAHEQQVGDLMHVRRAVPMLRDPHAVADDDALGLGIHLRGRLDVGARER